MKMRIAVIGAGVCGLYLSSKLSEKGNEVVVFEKRNKIGKEVCSGLFSERIFDFIPESKNIVQNKINFVLIHFPQKTLKVKFSGKFYVMDHVKLDNIAAELAKKSGVKIILNKAITSFPVGFEKAIGCDGAMSQTRKYIGGSCPKFRLAMNGFLNKKDYSDFVETWPTKNGFIWKIPRGENVEYGIMEKPENCQVLFKNFLENNEISLENIKSALVPDGFLIPKNDLVTLCGDSAGTIKPWSGGGVIWGLTGANFLLKDFPDFLKYKKSADKNFLPKIFFSKIATKTIYLLGFNFPWLIPINYKIDGGYIKKWKR
jgi:flavin-dependent dehydrogenase